MEEKSLSNQREAKIGSSDNHFDSLSNSAREFEVIFEQLPGAILITDASGRPIKFNKEAANILGQIPATLRPEEWPGQFGLFLDDGKTHYPGKHIPILRALKGESVTQEEMIHLNSNKDEERWIAMSARPFTSAKGKVAGAMVYITDITSRKKAEISRDKIVHRADLLGSLLRKITEAGNDAARILNEVVLMAAEQIGDAAVATLIIPPGDRLKVISFHHTKPEAQVLLHEAVITREYELEDAIRSVVVSGEPLLIPNLNQALLQKMALPEQTHYIGEIGIQSVVVVPIKGRRRILGTLSLSRDRGGSPYTSEHQTFLRDVAYWAGLAIENGSLVRSLNEESKSRQVAENALKQSEELFRSIFDSTTLGIKVLDLNGIFLETNPAFQEMFGFPQEVLYGKNIAEFLHPADVNQTLQLLDRLKNGHIQSFRLDHRLVASSGAIIWVNSTFTGIKNRGRGNRPEFIVAIAENITERKQMEAEMVEMKQRLQSHVEMERLALAQELHDGPLQELYAAIYSLKEWSNTVEPTTKDKFEDLRMNLVKVVQELRQTAKGLRPPVIEQFGLAKAIRSHAEELAEEHPELTIHLNLAEDEQVLSDDTRLILFRVYQNSMVNILRHARASESYVTFTYDAEEARIEIWDNGIGFEVPDNWVELTRQGHFGLAGAVERVALIDGQFSVDSKPGGGTMVRAVIPNKGNWDLQRELIKREHRELH